MYMYMYVLLKLKPVKLRSYVNDRRNGGATDKIKHKAYILI